MDNAPLLIFLFSLLILAVVAVSILLVISHLSLLTTYRKAVADASPRCNALAQLNEEYRFSAYEPVKSYVIQLDTKQKFDRYRLDDLLLDALENDRAFIQDSIACAQMNAEFYQDYTNRLRQLPAWAAPELAEELGIPFHRFQQYEKELFKSLLLRPVHTFEIVCTKCYCSPQGRNRYIDKSAYTCTDILKGFELLAQRLQYQETAQYQRRLMTDKLRRQIMQRDHFRCVLCGRDAQTSRLEVDHIRPVSKGGKTVPENLRTLCFSCNRGKGASYSPDGTN